MGLLTLEWHDMASVPFCLSLCWLTRHYSKTRDEQDFWNLLLATLRECIHTQHARKKIKKKHVVNSFISCKTVAICLTWKLLVGWGITLYDKSFSWTCGFSQLPKSSASEIGGRLIQLRRNHGSADPVRGPQWHILLAENGRFKITVHTVHFPNVQTAAVKRHEVYQLRQPGDCWTSHWP